MGKKGFSLLEIMVVVAIVGILAAIAIPSYTGYVTRTRRSEAVTALQTIALCEEKARAESGQYQTEAVLRATYGLRVPNPDQHYAYTINLVGTTDFTATAVPGGTEGFTDVVDSSNPYTLIFAIRADGTVGLCSAANGANFHANTDLWKSLNPPSSPF